MKELPLPLPGRAAISMLYKLSIGIVFVGGDIFGAELTGLELTLPHPHVQPEFRVVSPVQRVLPEAIARPISHTR